MDKQALFTGDRALRSSGLKGILVNHYLTSILIVGLILRLALAIYVGPFPDRYIRSDGVGYNQLAMNFLSGNGLSMRQSPPYALDNFRTPFYPQFLSAVYFAVGWRPEIVLFLQALIGTATIYAVYILAQLVSNRGGALFAAALIAISPLSITYCALLMSDTLYTLILTISIIFTVQMLLQPDRKWILLASLSMGVATLIHPRSLYLPLLIAVYALVCFIKQRQPYKRIILAILVYLVVFNLTLVPWRVRNQVVFGVPNFTSAVGINLLYYGAAITEASLTGEDQWSIAQRYEKEIRQANEFPLNEGEFAEVAFRSAIRKISSTPLTYAKVHLFGMLKTFMPGVFQFDNVTTGTHREKISDIFSALIVNPLSKDPLISKFNNFSWLTWGYLGFSLLYLLGIYILSSAAIVKNFRKLSWTWFFSILILYFAVVAGAAGAPRFQVAFTPLLVVLAMQGVLSVIPISRKLFDSANKKII